LFAGVGLKIWYSYEDDPRKQKSIIVRSAIGGTCGVLLFYFALGLAEAADSQLAAQALFEGHQQSSWDLLAKAFKPLGQVLAEAGLGFGTLMLLLKTWSKYGERRTEQRFVANPIYVDIQDEIRRLEEILIAIAAEQRRIDEWLTAQKEREFHRYQVKKIILEHLEIPLISGLSRC
jgi:hypothetical protein